MNFPQERKKFRDKETYKTSFTRVPDITSANYVIPLTAACGTSFVQ